MNKLHSLSDENITLIMDDETFSVFSALRGKIGDRGIRNYYWEVDENTETEEGLPTLKIYIQPTPNLEYIDLSFKVTPDGVVGM